MIHLSDLTTSKQVVERTGTYRTREVKVWWWPWPYDVREELVRIEFSLLAPGGLPVVKTDWVWVRA